MKARSNLKIIISIFFVMLIMSSFSLFIGKNSINKINISTNSYNGLKASGTSSYSDILWVDNPTFEIPVDPWYNTTDGDISDVKANTDVNQANFEVLGESFNFELIADPPNLDWDNFTNPRFPRYPDNFFNDSNGLNVFHFWDESEPVGQTHNTPSIHWKRNITMPVNMDDYIITYASVEAYYNATVTTAPYNTGGIDCPGDPGDSPLQFSTGDYARFYVLVSDPSSTYEDEVAYNQTVNLGQDSPAIPSYSDTLLTSIPQDILIAILTNLFKTNNREFTITLGIDIYCEDNESGVDRDRWDSLIFRYLNFTFSYVKKIDQFTVVSWNQDLNAINRTVANSTILITDANLNFKYKIDKNWTTSSQNSQIRIYINDRKYETAIGLIDYVYSTQFQEAQIGGFDIVSKLLPYEEFTLSIQVYLAEDFGLDHNITISVTDVYLTISYTESWTDPPLASDPEPWINAVLLVLVSAASICLGGYFIAYQRILKYPRPVRKVRKFKRTLNKSSAPAIQIRSRETAFKKSYNKALGSESKSARLKTSGTVMTKVTGRVKKPAPTVETKVDTSQLIDTSLEKKSELDKIVDKSLDEKTKPN
ncbi:MAG: hypothetical protein ACW98D_09145 [Promethearchaeota archaeon]|jgi:hypothetical protein